MTIEIRPASGYAELERWVATRNEVAPDDPQSTTMMALIRASELEHVNLLALLDGEVVGTAMLAGDPNSVESDHPYVQVMVPERHRGRGVGTALLREVSERARRRGKQGLHVDAREDDAYSLDYLARRGFVEQDRAHRLVLDLSQVDTPDTDPPDGVTVHWLGERPELVASTYRVAAETYPELGGPIAKQAGTLQQWQLYELGDPRVVLEATPVAVADGEAVGFAALLHVEDDRFGVHRVTVVRPAWRRRGIGSALTRAQIGAAKRASLERLEAWAWTDLQRRLYASVGYEQQAANIDFFGPLQ